MAGSNYKMCIRDRAIPYMKTGGLADVVGSLPKYFDKDRYDVRVILPKYKCMDDKLLPQLDVYKRQEDYIKAGFPVVFSDGFFSNDSKYESGINEDYIDNLSLIHIWETLPEKILVQ